jgi:multiple sugar transport system permease protein
VSVFGFLSPNLFGFLTFTAVPVAASLAMAFTNWNLQPNVRTEFVGVGNFAEILGDWTFWYYLANTVFFMLGIPISIAGSLGLAVLLTRPIRGIVAFRTLFYLPSVSSGVALMIMWVALYDPHHGPINQVIEGVLDFVGIDSQGPAWLASSNNILFIAPGPVWAGGRFVGVEYFGIGAREALIFMGFWTGIGGGNMLLYIAGISNVPVELYEAADVDGAGRWARFRHVTWPQLAPTTFFIVVISTIAGLQGGFDQARVMTDGGPHQSTTTLAYYIYQTGFAGQYELGKASAVAWLLFVMIFVMTVLNWRYGSRQMSY